MDERDLHSLAQAWMVVAVLGGLSAVLQMVVFVQAIIPIMAWLR